MRTVSENPTKNDIASDFIFKIIAVGDASVGKTSLTQRFATNRFLDDYRMTLGMNLTTKNVTLDGSLIQLAIWDTGGQASFEPLLPMYYKGAFGGIIVYDLTNRKTFESVEKWLSDVRQFAEEIPITIIGNKSDLKDKIQVTIEEGKELVDRLQQIWSKPIHFHESSAKEDVAVNDSFHVLARSILDEVESDDSN